MIYVKKFLFAPFFLITLSLACFKIFPILGSTNIIFTLSLDTFFQLVILTTLLLLSSLFFIIFATLAAELVLVLPMIMVAAFIPLALTAYPTGLILGGGFALVMLLVFLILKQGLSSYLSFIPSTLLSPSIKNLTTLLILSLSFSYFLSINAQIQRKGFQIPDSLIDTALKFTQAPPSQSQKTTTTQLNIVRSQISEQDIEELQKNPELLRQYGLNPSDLEALKQSKTTPSQTSQTTTSPEVNVKDLVKKQFQGIIAPYQNFIAPTLAVLLFFTLSSIAAILELFLSPVIWLIFLILEKTGFIKFTTETRSVKKMIV